MELAELSCSTAMSAKEQKWLPSKRQLATEETVTKYAVFCTKFLRCAIETLKKVKANQKGLFEVTDALKLGKMKHVKIFSCCLGVRSVLSSQKKLNVFNTLKMGPAAKPH